ncbi:hypothetical protein COLO4_16035 [Corchorus olitorius]|uniref:Uncharacterized protein n=1 Tax=Corchorus olitorius TaxID=93759 RepID=A0A1R3JKB9_9ROSI|nr:hypothetical protein COLO4_16035 [Corchorus olitorius]
MGFRAGHPRPKEYSTTLDLQDFTPVQIAGLDSDFGADLLNKLHGK